MLLASRQEHALCSGHSKVVEGLQDPQADEAD